MAVDPGDVRIGVAVSDPTGTIARPLTVIRHTSRQEDAERVAGLADHHSAYLLVVGVPYGLEQRIGTQARKALRFAMALRKACSLKVVTWDESGSSIEAMNVGRSHEPIDAVAAAVILQEYLDAQETN